MVRLDRRQILASSAAAFFLGGRCAMAEPQSLVLGATTSTDNSGLLNHLLPQFEAATGISVRVVIAGTGAVLKLAERGDVDVVLVHERAAEDAFVASGHGTDRRDVMHNDFVLVGPEDDPAKIAGFELAADALAQILRQRAPFLSRGDESGTHQAELRLWRRAGLDPHAATGGWYRASGAGMGATLNIATNMGAYTLTDRATWTSFHNREGLRLLVEGDPSLHNPYGVIRVNPERFGEINAKAALAFADWLTGEDGRAAIESFRIDGTQVFFVGEVERRVGM